MLRLCVFFLMGMASALYAGGAFYESRENFFIFLSFMLIAQLITNFFDYEPEVPEDEDGQD